MLNTTGWKSLKNAWRSNEFAANIGCRSFHIVKKITWPIRHPHQTVQAAEPWGILLAVIVFAFDYYDRGEQRTISAWQLLLTEASGNSYKKEAMEHLVKNDQFLYGINISGKSDGPYQYLHSANLQNAKIPNAKLRYVDLSSANLIGTTLDQSDLTGASLTGANLSDANLRGVKLREADLSSVTIRGANLSGADLSGATGLNQKQLNNACGNIDTILPGDFHIEPCVSTKEAFYVTGMISNDVQNAMIFLGYFKGVTGNSRRSEVKQAIRDLEKSFGLPADGIPDTALLNRLLAELDARSKRRQQND